MEPKRRHRSYYVNAVDFLHVFSIQQRIADAENGRIVVAVPLVDRIPSDAKIVSCHASWDPPAVEIVLEHDSFDEVGYYDKAPNFGPIKLDTVTVCLKVADDSKQILEEAIKNHREKFAQPKRRGREFI